VPAARSRAEQFDALVLEAFEPIETRWAERITELDIAVDDVPELGDLQPRRELAPEWDEAVTADREVPLARLAEAGMDDRGTPTRARVVLYRRPLEARAEDHLELAGLVHDVLVEQVAQYLGVDPDTIDG
jgi:predicted Zn-dependent protease with MMP-like domain